MFREFADAGARSFLQITGTNVTVRDMIVTGFGEGIVFGGINGTVDNATLDRQCDDSITVTPGQGYGAVVSNSVIKEGVDKCTQLHKGGTTLYTPGAGGTSPQCDLPADSSGTEPNRGCYHVSFYDTDFQGCHTPLKVSNGSSQGNLAKVYVSNVVVTELAGQEDTATAVFACDRNAFEGTGAGTVADFVDLSVSGCDVGLSLAGDLSKYRMKGISNTTGSIIQLSEEKGLVIGTSGAVLPTLRNTQIMNNGGFQTTAHPSGGVGIEVDADLDAGTDGTTNKGGNKISCNKRSDGTAYRDVHNLSGTNVTLRGNNWGTNGSYVTNVNNGNNVSSTNVDATIADPFGTSSTCVSRP